MDHGYPLQPLKYLELETLGTSYLEFFQLVLSINCQGWIHGLILLDKVLESTVMTVINDFMYSFLFAPPKGKNVNV